MRSDGEFSIEVAIAFVYSHRRKQKMDVGESEVSSDTDQHFEELHGLGVLAKRAAYSDRMAWIMSLLSEIVYKKFDDETDTYLKSLAE